MIGRGITPATLLGGAATAGLGFLGIRAGMKAAASIPAIMSSGISSFSTASALVPKMAKRLTYSSEVHGYGKRGIDADRLNTSGLVQAMHNKRRTLR